MAGNTNVDITLNGKNNTQAAFSAVTKQMQQLRGETDKASAGFALAGRLMGGAIAGISVGGVMSAFIRETGDAQKEQAQLASVLKSTGEAAGWSQQQLNDMADALEGRSIFSGGDINRAQTSMLEFTGVVGQQFPRAIQAAADMAARRSMDIASAAETVGRALDVPSQGLTALSKQGFRFTEDQKKLIKSLEDTGRVAEAQDIILKTLEGTYGGAAQAARDTFGGALTALQNKISSLMTGGDGSLNGATTAVNSFTDALGGPQAQKSFAMLTSNLDSLLGYLAELAGSNVFKLLVSGANSTGIADWASNQVLPLVLAKGDVELALSRAEDKLQRIRADREQLIKRGWDTKGDDDLIDGLQREIASYKQYQEYDKQLERDKKNAQLDSQNAMLRNNYRTRAPSISGSSSGVVGSSEDQTKILAQYASNSQKLQAELDRARKAFGGTIPADLEARIRSQFAKAGSAGGKSLADALSAARDSFPDAIVPQQVIESVSQIARTSGIKEAERALKSYAKQYSDSANLEIEMGKLLASSDADAITRARDQATAYYEENQRMRESLESIGLTDEGLAELEKRRVDDAIATAQQALASAKLHGASESEIGALEDQILLLQEKKGLIDDTYLAEKAKTEMGEVSEFAKQAARNIQDSLGTTLKDVLKGDFDDIGSNFSDMLYDMAAQAAAAQLNNALFGNWSTTGSMGGIVGAGFSAVSSFFGFGGGRASGGGVSPGTMYEVAETAPELLTAGGRTFLMMGQEPGYVTAATTAASASAAPAARGGGLIVNIHKGADEDRVQQSSDGGQLDVWVRDSVRGVLGDELSKAGGGMFGQWGESRYGWRKQPNG